MLHAGKTMFYFRHSSHVHALHELTALMLSAPILVNGIASAFHVFGDKPAQTTIASTAIPLRETNPWAQSPAAPAVAKTGAVASPSGKTGH